MGLLRNVAIGVLAISLLTFIALFGQLPALRKTPIGWLQRALCLHLPHGLGKIDHCLTGGRISQRSVILGNYLFYERNPIVLILFLFLLTGSAFLFLRSTLAELHARLLWPIAILLPAPYIFTYLCASHEAHYIVPENHDMRMKDYPYDYMIFRPGVVCKTCHLLKPARSKHCSLCGYCVAKCDHHCPWVNNCLGQGNYRYFLALLLSLGFLQVYGAYLSWWILRPHLDFDPRNSFFSRGFLNDLGRAFAIAINEGGISVAGVGFLAASTAALPFGLFAYHCYLIWAGMTTNESQKWSDWEEDASDGFAFRTKREHLREHNRRREVVRSGETASSPALSLLDEGDAIDVRWPVRNDDILVRTRDGHPPVGQEALWTRVRGLEDITNIYDLGAWQNLVETLQGR